MKPIQKVLITTLICLFCFTIVHAQTSETIEVSDLETWTSIQVEYELNKKWSFELEEQLRLKNNSSELASYFTEFSTTYKLPYSLKLGLGFRYNRANDNKGAKSASPVSADDGIAL